MKLEHAVNTKGDVVSVEFFDNDDEKQVKLWIKVEVPPGELRAYAQKQLAAVDAIDILAGDGHITSRVFQEYRNGSRRYLKAL